MIRLGHSTFQIHPAQSASLCRISVPGEFTSSKMLHREHLVAATRPFKITSVAVRVTVARTDRLVGGRTVPIFLAQCGVRHRGDHCTHGPALVVRLTRCVCGTVGAYTRVEKTFRCEERSASCLSAHLEED